MRWALVTGTSTGIGRALVLRLLQNGVGVFAGVRRDRDAADLKAAAAGSFRGPSSAQLIPIQLDVANEAQMQVAIRQISETVGSDGLWALVNNAGIVVPGPVEHLSLDDWRRQFEVNLFGVAELTRLSLPLLRRAVITFGTFVPRILIVSSIGGRVAQPIMSPYTSSKFAVTALGDSLRLELHRQGIGVTVLEPGAVATAIWAKGDQAAESFGPDHPARPIYGPEIDGLASLARKTAAGASPPDKVADIVLHALTACPGSGACRAGRKDRRLHATMASPLLVRYHPEEAVRHRRSAGSCRVVHSRVDLVLNQCVKLWTDAQPDSTPDFNLIRPRLSNTGATRRPPRPFRPFTMLRAGPRHEPALRNRHSSLPASTVVQS
jgi:NAD(P)-dependent dehydrogenase (short-subunit alcohol dehydrogenase family)